MGKTAMIPTAVDSISPSGLTRVKLALCRQRMPPSNSEFLVTGSALHSRVLENDYTIPLNESQLMDVQGMEISLGRDKVFQTIMKDAKYEQQINGIVHGQAMHGILDIHKYNLISDIKTTSTKTQREFEVAARKYGYFRQAYCYGQMTGVGAFVFVGVRKSKPWDVFHLDIRDYPEDMKYAQEEVKFLISLYKQFPHLANK